MTDSVASPLLSVRALSVCFEHQGERLSVVDGLDFDIRRGETLALLGESGCGKSMTALALMGLLPDRGVSVADHMLFDGEELRSLSAEQRRRYRGSRIAMIFQEPMTSLNPVLSIAQQLGECLSLHCGLRGRRARQRMVELLTLVGIPAPEKRLREYPHQLSGGMKQRVMIAMALAGEPELLIADEPTTALDVTTQAQVLRLLRDIQQQTGMAILLITHDLGVVAQTADRVAVMYAGHLLEQGGRQAFFAAPQHPYTLKLFAALPGIEKRGQLLDVLQGTPPSPGSSSSACRFAGRCEYARPRCREEAPAWRHDDSGHAYRCHFDQASLVGTGQERGGGQTAGGVEGGSQSSSSEVLLDVVDIKLHFAMRRSLFSRKRGYVHAVDGLDLRIEQGKTLALVGESGCGKTSVGQAIMQLQPLTSGRVSFEGQDLSGLGGEAMRQQRRAMQMIFQDPFSAMNPRMRVGDIIAEGVLALGQENRAERQALVADLLERVGLSAGMASRYPHEFSGGQRQRICIARALALRPKLIVCDEPTSALDVSVQAQILNLLRRLQQEMGLAYLFISHNISVVAYLAHEVAVMYLGRIVERGLVHEVLDSPRHPYTQALLSAVPTIHSPPASHIAVLEGEMPSPIEPPSGCYFHPRCPRVTRACRENYPVYQSLSVSHKVACTQV